MELWFSYWNWLRYQVPYHLRVQDTSKTRRYVGRDDIVWAAAKFSYLLSSAARMSEAVNGRSSGGGRLMEMVTNIAIELSWNHSRIMINDLSASDDTLGGQETETRDA